MRNMTTILLVIAAMMFVSCGGGGGSTIIDPNPTEQTASVDGYLTQGGISDRAASALDDAVEGAEIWCEDPVTGEVLGQDATDASGYFMLDGLPTGVELMLQFRFRAEGGLADVEGGTKLNLRAGIRQRIDMRIRQHDADGDGETDAVDGERDRDGNRDNLDCQIRPLIGDGVPPLPELDQITDLLLDTRFDAEPLPPMPLDEDETDSTRDASELTGDFVVLGPDFMRKFNGRVTDNSLVLNTGDHRLAWGLYKIGGLNGHDIASLSVECAPLTDDGSYFIGVSNYSRRHWEWSGPVSATEFTFEVNQRSRHVSPHGNLYFLVAVFHNNSAEFFAGQANPRDPDDGDRPRPHAPIHLQASDGQTENGVAVHWRVMPRDNDQPIDNFIVMRATTDRSVSQDDAGGPDRRFEEIGQTTETAFFDETAHEGVVYLYAVLAVSGDERSGRSNVDRGFWVVRDTPERYPLGGVVVTAEGAGVGGVLIVVAHGDHRIHTITGPDGHFLFPGLPAGMYSVTPHKRGATFDPEAARVELPQGDERLVFVAKRIDDGGDPPPGDG